VLVIPEEDRVTHVAGVRIAAFDAEDITQSNSGSGRAREVTCRACQWPWSPRMIGKSGSVPGD
jgi:hypothetical protein